MSPARITSLVAVVAGALVMAVVLPGAAFAADVVTDGDMEAAGTTFWPHTDITDTNSSVKATDQSASGQSLKGSSAVGRLIPVGWYNAQNVGTINDTDTVTLSLWYGWRFNSNIGQASGTVFFDIRPASGSWTNIWSQSLTPLTTFQSGSVTDVPVSSSFAATTSYDIRLRFEGTTGNKNDANIDIWWDDVVLDVTPQAGNDTLSTSNPTPIEAGPVDAGATDVVMLRFQVDSDNAGNNSVELDSVTVDDLGTAGAGDWTSLQIYIDTDTTFAGSTLIGTEGSWNGTSMAVTLNQGTAGDRTVTFGSSKYVFVVYNVADAAEATTLQARVTDVGVVAPDNGVTGITYDSNVVNVNADTLVTSNNTPVQATDPFAGDSGVVMQYFQVDNDGAGNNTLALSTVTVNDLGTAGAGDWDNLRIYIDTDTTFAGSALIGQVGGWNGTSTAVALNLGTPGDRTVTTGTPKYMFVVYDLNAGSAGQTIQSQVTAVSVASPDNGVTGLTFNSNPLTIQAPTGGDSLLTSNPTPVETGPVDAGASNVVMLHFQVDSDTTGNGSIQLDTLTVDDLGSAGTGDWDSLQVYIDTDAGFAGSTLIGTEAAWNGTSTAVALNQGTPGDRTVTNGTPKFVFVVYNVADAGEGETLQARVTDVGVVSPDSGVSGLTYDSNVVNVNVDTLTASNNTPVQSADPTAGQTNVVMQRFQVDSDTAGSNTIELATVTVDDLGTATAGDWTNLEVFIDTDTLFAGSTLIGQVGSWDGSSTAVTLNLGTAGDRTVTAGTPKHLFIVYDIAAGTDGKTIQSRVTAVGVASPDNGHSGLTFDSNLLTIQAAADDATTVLNNSAQASSCKQITVTTRFVGDANDNGSTLVQYRVNTPQGPWIDACPGLTGASPRQCLVAGSSDSPLTPGETYDTHVVYTDSDGLSGSSDEILSPIALSTCAADDAAPTVRVLAPRRDGVVSGIDRVKVQVYDAQALAGTDPVQWSLNGGGLSAASENTNYSCGDGCSVWEFDLNTTGLANDSHYLTIRVTDLEGNAGEVNWGFRSNNQSATEPGGGGLLLRRTHGSQLCTDCHNLASHSSQSTSTDYGNWSVGCLDCHTPHRTQNIFLIREEVRTPNSGKKTVQFHLDDRSGSDTNPGDLPGHNPGQLSFLGDRSAGSNAPYDDGICEACHTRTKFWRNTSAEDHAHNADTRCAKCHTHENGFFGGGGGCLGCHGNQDDPGTTGPNTRRPVNPDFAKQSHHVGDSGVAMGGTRTDFDCVVCHAEGRINAANETEIVGAYHENTIIDLKSADDWDDTTSSGTVFSYNKDAVATSAGAAVDWNSGDSVWVTQTSTQLDPFCLTCHDADGALDSKNQNDTECVVNGDPLNPFCDGTVTNDYDQYDRGRVTNVASRVVSSGSDLDQGGEPRGPDGVNDPTEGIYSRHAVRGAGMSASIYGTQAIPTANWNRTQFAWNDTSVMGCADCHTTDGANAQDGNAHGSDSEYLLKDAGGLAREGTLGNALYNCYLCHSVSAYADGQGHTGNPSDYTDFTGQTGSARVPVQTAGGNIYAMACTNCHGGALDNGGVPEFGTIHGTSQVFDIRDSKGNDIGDRQAYRFTNGNSLRFYDPLDWSQADATCYTLDKGESDSFGSCTKHGGGTDHTRGVTRNLSY